MSQRTFPERKLAAGAIAPWFDVFDVECGELCLQEISLSQLTVSRNDVFTSKLEATVVFYEALKVKSFTQLPGALNDLGTTLDILCQIATFNNLARSGFGKLKAPGFWVRQAGEKGGLFPALPVAHAARLCKIPAPLLRVSLVPLIKDGAVEFVRAPGGDTAILLSPGFINDSKFRIHLKV